MSDAAVVAGVYGAQLPEIDDPRAQAVRRTVSCSGGGPPTGRSALVNGGGAVDDVVAGG